MDMYNVVLENIAIQYSEQTVKDTLIILERNYGNRGGNCKPRDFSKDILYKIILPYPLISPENFKTFFWCYESGKFHPFSQREKDLLVTEYEETVTSFFLKFHRDIQSCGFFTNTIPLS